MQAKVTNMELRVRLRYKSTFDFGKGDHLNFDKSLAHALEWLYDEDQFEDERTWLYCMEGVLPIYVMMSIVTDIFTFALQDYAETNIKDYILRMEEGNYKHGLNDNKPSLLYLGDEIVIGRVHTFTSEVILWATYLYASFRADIEEDNEKLKKAKDVLYKLFWKKTGLKEEFIKDTFLMKHFNQTIRDFAMDVLHRYKEDKPVANNKPQQTPANKKIEESVLNKIPANNWCFYYEGWRNGKKGGFVQEHGVYRFREMIRNKCGILESVHDKESDNPIVAVGIVAYWLMFNSKKELVLKRLTQYKNGIPQDIREQFDNYTKEQFVQFKVAHRDDPLTWDWDWEYDFYTKYIIPHEIELNKKSEALFDYISDSDVDLVRAVMKNYIKYLKKCRAEKGYRVSPELLVLRAVDSQDDTKYEDLDDFEVNTIFDKLESNGYIKVAWVEGHVPEAVRLLDAGRMRLKELEKKTQSVECEVERLQRAKQSLRRQEKMPIAARERAEFWAKWPEEQARRKRNEEQEQNRRDWEKQERDRMVRMLAEFVEQNRSETNNDIVEEHGKYYYGKNVAIFHENLLPDKIACSIIAIDRKGIPIRHFCLILHTVFSSLNGCLTTTNKTKFINWVKYNCKIYFESNDLKKVSLSDDEKLKIEEYKAIFADKQLDGKWIFKKKFYRTDLQGDPLQSIEKIR